MTKTITVLPTQEQLDRCYHHPQPMEWPEEYQPDHIPGSEYAYLDECGETAFVAVLNCTGGVHPVHLHASCLWGGERVQGGCLVAHSRWSAPCTPTTTPINCSSGFLSLSVQYRLHGPPRIWVDNLDRLVARYDRVLLVVSSISLEGFRDLMSRSQPTDCEDADEMYCLARLHSLVSAGTVLVGAPVLDADRETAVGFTMLRE